MYPATACHGSAASEGAEYTLAHVAVNLAWLAGDDAGPGKPDGIKLLPADTTKLRLSAVATAASPAATANWSGVV